MSRIVVILAVALAVIAGGWFYLSKNGEELAVSGTDQEVQVNAAVSEVGAAAKAFCEEKGGTTETITAAEGSVMMCKLPDGSNVEATQYMIDNKPE